MRWEEMTENANAAPMDDILELFMHANEATAIYQGEDLEIKFANNAMLAFWNKESDIIGKTFAQGIPELSGQPFEGLLKEVWRTGETYTARDTAATLSTTDGLQTFYFDFIYKAIKDASGSTKWILHTASEVTERNRAWKMFHEKEGHEKHAKEALLNSQYRIEQLVLSSPVGMTILKGKDLIIEFPNEHILQIWGRQRHQVVGEKLLDIFPELLGQPFPGMLDSVLETGIPVFSNEIPVTIGLPDGSARNIFVDFAYQPLFDIEGKTDSVMVTVKDISEMVNTRQKLEDSRSLLQEANEALQASNEEYLATNEELAALNEEFEATNEELTATNEEVYRLTQELSAANTHLKEHNHELAEVTKKLFALFEDAPVAIGLLQGRELTIDYANPEILRLWGKDATAVGKTLSEAIPELKGQEFLRILDRVFLTGTPYVGKAQRAILQHEGQATELFFNFTYKPITDEEGKTHSIMIVANEVTDQVKNAQAIEAAYQELNYALDVGNLGSYEIDLISRQITYNTNFARDFALAGTDRIELDSLLDRILPEYRDRLESDIEYAIEKRSALEGEFQIRWDDGSRHWIKASGKAIYDVNGRPQKLVGMTENITDQKAFDQRKDDFLSIASHELKTPITTLRANLQLLDRFKPQLAHPVAEKMIETSVRNMDRLTGMIDNLLNINRFTEGQVILEKDQFSLRSLLEDCCGNVRGEGTHEITVIGDDVIITADQARIEQVLNNLVNNAVKYAAKSPNIELTMETQVGCVKISVKDQGPGISEEQVPHLFERYWRASHEGAAYSGLGLGLFICSEIIKWHGGEIGVESEIGKGTEFWFTLPL